MHIYIYIKCYVTNETGNGVFCWEGRGRNRKFYQIKAHQRIEQVKNLFFQFNILTEPVTCS